MKFIKLDIQLFADGKVVIDTELNTKNFESGLDKMKSTSQKAGSTIKNIVLGLGITKVIGAAMNQINASIDGAVARVDTLNNFPKVMSNLGISSENASESISKMSDKLSGLPTTLDQGAMAVQRFASANGDVAKSTDIFLALNNAILAGGASSEIQASALEQLSQAYAKGKPDMMEWRTAMTAMPAQLKQVAEAMGYVSSDQLGEALRSGEVSMDEFMQKIVELNEKGLDGFQNFEQQARNSTGGIGTAITVAKTQITKGVADIIGALNVKLSDIGLGSISDLIANIGKKAKEGLDVIAGLIAGELTITDVIEKATNLVSTYIKTINDKLPDIIQTGMSMIAELITGIAKALPTLIPQTVSVIMTIVTGLLDNIDLIIDAAIELIIGLTEGLINSLPILVEKVPIIIEKLVQKLTDPEMIGRLWYAAAKLIVELAIGLIKAIPQLLKGTKSVKDAIYNAFMTLPNTIYSVGKNIVKGIWDGISSNLSWIKNKISGWVGDVVSFFKKILKIHSPSQLMADEIGSYMAEGVGMGFENEIDNVYRDMQRAIDMETSKMTANVQTSGTYQLAMNGTPTFNLRDNTTNKTQLVVNGRVLADVVNTENRNREVAKA